MHCALYVIYAQTLLLWDIHEIHACFKNTNLHRDDKCPRFHRVAHNPCFENLVPHIAVVGSCIHVFELADVIRAKSTYYIYIYIYILYIIYIYIYIYSMWTSP